VVCFAYPLLILWRWPWYRCAACTISNAPSVHTSILFSSNIRHPSMTCSTSGLVTICGRLLDKALGCESTCASISDRCCSLRDNVDWVNNNACSGLVAKYFTTSPWLIGWGSVHISIHGHPIKESEVFSLRLLNGSCGTFWKLFDGRATRLRHCVLPWMGCFRGLRLRSFCGMAMEAERLPRSISRRFRCQKKISFPCDYRQILLIAADRWVQLWLISESHTA